MGHPAARVRAWLAAAAVLLVWLPVAAFQQAERVNPQARALADFREEIEEYLELHKKLEATLPPRPEHATPGEIEAHEQALANLIVQARSRAKQGDLLPQKVRAYFRRQVGAVLRGPDGAVIRQSIMEDNPGKVRLRCNARYPEGLPITTMPAPILGALPKLPDHVEYRFVGDRLVLLDIHSQLVMDYMTDALPL